MRADLLEPPRRAAAGSARPRSAADARSGTRRAARRAHDRPRFGARTRWPALAVGAGLDARGRLVALRPADDFQRRRGAHAVLLAARDRAPTGARRGGIAGCARRGALAAPRPAVAAGLRPGEAALARGMVLGEDERSPSRCARTSARSGLAHLLAASGSERDAARRARRCRSLAALGLGLRARLIGRCSSSIALYVPLAGAGPSIQRAGVMGAAGLVAALAGRPASRWYALLLAAAVDARAQPARGRRPGLAALASPRSSRSSLLAAPLRDALRRARRARAARRGRRAHDRGDARHRAAARLPLRAGLARLAARQPARRARGRAGHVAGDARGRGRAGRAGARRAGQRAGRVPARLPRVARHARRARPGRRRRRPARLAAGWSRRPTRRSARAAACSARGAARRARGRGGRGGGAGAVAVAAALRAAAARRGPPPTRASCASRSSTSGQGDATLVQHGGAAVLVDTGPAGRPDPRAAARGRGAAARRAGRHPRPGRPRGRRAPPCSRATRSACCSTAATAPPRRAHRASSRPPRGAACGIVAPDAGQRLRAGPLELDVLWPRARAGRAPRRRGPQPARDRRPPASTAPSTCCCPPTPSPTSPAPLDLAPVEALKVAHHGSADPGLAEAAGPPAPAGRGDRGRPRTTPTATRRPRRSARCAPCRASTGPTATAPSLASAAIASPTARDDRRRRGRLSSTHVPSFKPAYLIHGDDHGRIAERRARLRALAERESGAGGLEVLEGDAATPEAAAAALSAMTLALGPALHRRRRRRALEGRRARRRSSRPSPPTPPDTTIAFFAREDGRAPGARAARRRRRRRRAATSRAERNVKPWELPEVGRRAGARARARARPRRRQALVAQVGERQQRLLRELEKLALELGAGAPPRRRRRSTSCAARSAERRAWTLADALVGARRPAAPASTSSSRAQGERLASLLYQMTRRLRQALDVAAAPRGRRVAGAGQARRCACRRRPPSGFVADVRARTATRCARRSSTLADLELDSRGGRAVPRGHRRPCGRSRRADRLGGRAGAQARGPRLLARAVVGVQRAALDGLVDRRDQLAVLGVRARRRRRRPPKSRDGETAS